MLAGRQLVALLVVLGVVEYSHSSLSAETVNVNVTLPEDLLEPPGAGNFTPRLILAVEVNGIVLSTGSYDEFARNTSSALRSYLYSLFPDTFTLADRTLCSRCVQAGTPVRGLQEIIFRTAIDSEGIQPGYAPFTYTIWLPNNIEEPSFVQIEGILQSRSLDTLFAASSFTDQMFEIEKILDTRKLQDYFSVEADILDLLAATSRLSKVASLTGEKLLKSSNATDVTIVASNDNHSKDMSKRVTVAASRNNLTSIAGVNVAFRTSPEASKNTSMVSVYYPEDVVSKWCTGMIANETDCKNGEGLITTLAYWFSSSQEFAAVTDWTSGLDSLREQLGSGNLPTRKLASHSGGAQEGERPGLDVPEVLPVSGVLDVKATYQDYIPAELEAWLGIPVQADAFEAERLTSCVRLEQATTGLGFVATYLPSSTAPGISGPWGCRVQFPGRYLVVQLKEDGQGGQPPGGGQPGGGQGPIALPPAQRIEQLLSQALELGKDIVPPEFTEVFSFIAMVDGRLLDGQVFRTLTDLANDIQRSLAKFLSQNIPLGDVFRDIGPCPACIEAVDIVSQGSLPDWDLIGALVPSATSIRYRVHLPVEVPGLDVQNIAWTVILRSPLESILGSSPAQQMVMFFQEAYDAAENLVEDLADYSGRRYTQVQNELRSAYQIGKSLVEMADSTDIGTTLQTNFGSINAAFSRIAAEVAVSSPDIQFRVIPTNNSAEIIMGSVQTNTPDRTEWCSRVDCNGGLLETLVVYYQDVEKLDLNMDAITSLLNRANVLEAIPLSGVLDVQSVLRNSANSRTTLLCNFEGEGCRLNLQIPVNKAQWRPGAVVQCVHLDGGLLEGLQSLGSSILDALTSSPAGADIPDTVNCVTDTTGWHMLVGMMPIPERPGPPLDLALTVFPLMLPGGFSSGLPFMNGSWSDGLPAANGSFIDKLYETAPNLMMALGLLNSNGTHRTCERCIEIPSTGQVPSPLEAMDVLMRITPNPSIASAEELYAMLWEQRSSLLGSQASRFGEVAYIFPPTPELGNVAAELPKFEVNVTLTLEVGSNINVPPVGDFIPPVGDFFPPVDDFFPPVGDFVPPGVSVPPIDDFVPPIDDFVPPVDDFVPPVDDFVPPVDDFVPPGASVPPIGDFVPPVGDFVPPVGDFVPPVGDFVPPAGDFVPPVGGFVPPVGDFVPPPVDDIAPPPVDDIAPPPVGDFVPPVGDFVPPVGDLVPPPVDDVLPPADDVVDGILGRRRSLRNAHADTLIPGLSMGISEIKDRINKTLAPALGAALDESTSNLGNPLQHIEITADFDFEPGEVYSVGVLMTIPSPFLIPEKLDAFMVALEAETQGGLPISSELTIKVSGIRGTFIPPRPPEFPPPGAVPPPPPLSPCDLCEACVARVYEEIVTIALDYRSSPYPSPDLPIPSGPNIPQELRPYVREKLCSGASNRSACQEVFSEIEASEVLRAAALCNYLGQCSPEDECQIASQRAGGVVAEMDFCTTDGTVKGELIGRKSIQPVGGDSCFSDDDCQDGETLQFCDKEGGNTTVQSYCNEQGFEVSKVQGVCTNRTTGAMPPPPVLSPCELCEDCVSRLYQEVVNNTLEFRSNISIESLPPDLMPPNIPQEARALVLERLCPVTTDGGACEKVYSEIKAPEVLRAAALCNHLGQCSPEDECQIVSPTAGGEAADMDFCTTDGTIFGELIGQKTIELDGGDSCFSDEDCIDGETFQLCDKAGNTTIKSFCNEQGFEVVEVQGVCANKTIGVPPPPVLSPCDLCEDCVSRVYQEVVTNTLEFRSRISIESLSPDLMPPNIPQEARALVLERLCPVTTDGEACEKVYSEIKAPEVLRAAALCNHLELCSPEDECQIASQSAGGEVADMDFCTTDGTVNGEMISQKSIELDGGDSCFLDEDCADGGSDRFCDKEGGNTTIKSYCNEQGFEVVKVQGECANKCRLPQGAGLIEQSQVTNCTSDQDCPEGESCQEAGPSCRVYSCNEETGEITTEPCGQICLPSAISTNLGLAYFEDSGDVIRVNLSTAAAEISLPCIVLFGGDANKELGSSAECRTTGQELVIGLSGDASIRPNETVSLREDQQALVAANSGTPFSGTSGAIQSCSNCAQPEAVVSGPTTLAPACEGTEFGAAVISGAQSSSPAGRSFDDVTWELVDHPSEYRPSSSDTMMRLLEEASQENRLVIRMGEDALESMPASDEPYTIRLSVTSFLGTSHSTNHSIVRQSSTGTPTVTLTTPSRAKITQGIVLDAEASRSSVCGKGEYKWSCEGHTPAGASSPENCTLLDNGYGRRLTRRISMDELQQEGVQPGDTLTFKLVARYEGQPATESETETEVEVLGADLEARLDGPSGTVQQSANEPLIFDASGSSDPLASGGANSSMEYSFSCFRLDVEGGFCFEPVSYQPSQDGPNDPTLSVNATKFAALDTAYLFTVTVSKDGRTATAGNVILLRGGEVTDVSVTRFCGGRQTICPSTHNPTELLSLAASFEASQGSALSEASYSWSFTDDQAAELGMQLDENNTASGTNSYAVLIKPEAIPRSGFVAVQCTVTLSAGASGTGIIRVPLHRPPVCTLPNGCLEILGGEDGRNKTLPSIDFPASATGFSSPDEDETLQYEFGFKDGDDFEASGSATSSNEHTFIATEGPGTYTPYVCAIDSRKARTCSESSFTLNSNSSISESDVQKLLDGIDFASLQDTGDDDAVFDGVSRLAAQLKGAQGSENEGSNIGNNEVVAALQSLNDTLNNEGSDTSTAVTAISRQYDLSDFATRSTDANDKSAETTVSALELIEKGQSENADPTSPSVAGKALSNLGNIGSSAGGRRRRSLQAVTEQTKTNLDRVGYAIKIIGRDLADQVSPGSTIVSDGGNIAMAAVRNSYQALSGANVEFSPSASNGARAGVFFQPDLADFCSQAADCNLQDRVTAVLAYVADSSVYTAVTNSWPSIQSTLNSKIQGEQGTDYGAINGIEAISGAMSIEVGGQNNGPLCDGSSCTMSVKIPVDVGMYNDSRELACARWSPPEGVSSSSDLPLDVNVTTTSGNLGVTEGTVTCDTTHLGTHFIVQYDLADADLEGDGNAPPPFPPSNPTEEVNVSPLPPIPASAGEGDGNPSPPPFSPPPTPDVSPPPPTTEVSPSPPPPTTEVSPSPPPPTTEVSPSPPPPTTEVSPSPPPPTTEVSPSPPPPTTEVSLSPPPPTTEVSPPPPPTAGTLPDRRSGANSITITSTLDLNYNDVTESAEKEQVFKNNVTQTVAENLRDVDENLMTLENGKLCYECVRVVNLRQGSVVVDMEVDLPDSIDEEKLDSFAESVEKAGSQVFENSRFEDKVMSLSAEASGANRVLAGPAVAIIAPLITLLWVLL